MLILLSMKLIENLNLRDWSFTKRINGLIKRLFGELNKTESSKKNTQETDKKLRNYEGSVAKKQIEPDS